MLQAFVSLKHQQPPRTESGLQSFLEALTSAAYSPPTFFCTNLDATPQSYTVDGLTQACLHQKCKFAVVRGDDPLFWQATILMPDKEGLGALFFQFESDTSACPTADQVIEFTKKLYKNLEPRIIRAGDSEAREKLKSRHGLVLMPGLGRVEWLQVVHPDVYGELYNPSELVAAPAYAAEIWEDGALFLRVYGDPKDWDNEENISLANFIPGFLAGTANVTDGEKEKQNVRIIEKLWNRANKTAERAAEIFDPPSSNAAAVAKPTPVAPKPEPVVAKPTPVAPKPEPVVAKPEPVVAKPEPVAPKPEPVVAKPEPVVAKPEPDEDFDDLLVAEPTDELDDLLVAEPETEDAAEATAEPALKDPPSPAEVASIISEQSADIELDSKSVTRLDTLFDQTIYRAQDAKTGDRVFIAFSPTEDKLRVLDKLEDFAAFLQAESLNVQESDRAAIVDCVKRYHRPYVTYIDSVDDVSGSAGSDPRLKEFEAIVKPAHFDVSDETQQLHVWAYNPRNSGLEEILIRQFEDWPLTMEIKRHILELKEPTDVAAEVKTKKKKKKKKKAENPNQRRVILLGVLLLILALAALAYVYILGADPQSLWHY